MLRREFRISLIAGALSFFSLLTSTFAFGYSGTSYTASSTAYVINTFTGNESWTVPYGVTSIDAIAVGGGGGGGTDGGDGGGGGELRVLTSQSVSVGNVLATTIGGGGAGAVWSSTGSSAGGITYLKKDGVTLLQANGGAGGAGWTTAQNRAAGGTGGSGGTGYNGGAGGMNRYQQNEGIGGVGGDGPTTTITTGSAVNYGGGGGGGSCWAAKTSGTYVGAAGGAGGGGAGAGHTVNVGSPAGFSGSANTGGGGGGGSACDGGNTNTVDQRTSGGAGASGVVVVRYILTAPNTLDLTTASDSGVSATDNITNVTTPTFTGIAVGGTSIQLYVNGSASGSPCTANTTTGIWSCTTATLNDGVKSIVARSTISGISVDSSSFAITIDATGPTLSPSAAISKAENITSIATITCSETCTLAMTGGVDSASVTFTAASGVLVFKTAPDYEAPTDVGANQTYAITISATDNSGNTTVVNYVVTITNANETWTIGAPTLSGSVYKGVTTSLRVSINAPGKVLFRMDGKRIPNCLAVPTTGSYPNYLATCNWKPAGNNYHVLDAVMTTSDSTFSGPSSPKLTAFILRRTNTR